MFLRRKIWRSGLPKYEIINFKEAQESKLSVGHFSQHLIDKISENLEHKNKPSFCTTEEDTNVVECESCGHVTYCSNCDVVMTYHKSTNELKCHYCGHKAQKPKICPKCQSTNLNTHGIGIEQIEEETQKILKEAQVERMDVDSMRKKFAYENSTKK